MSAPLAGGVDLGVMERPLDHIPDIASWSENYAWDAYDPKRRIGIYLHTGRWWRDTTLWRELILICVDGREVYARRNIAKPADPAVVGASNLKLSCEEPGKRWRWRYHGPVLRGTAEEMMQAPPADAAALLLDFDLEWTAVSPIIDFGHGTEPGASASHYEQGGRLKGMIDLGDGAGPVAFDGATFRDHSRGPRVLQDHFNRHAWIHGTMPSGRTLSTLLIETPGGQMALADLFAVEADRTTRKYAFETPLLWDAADDFTKPYVIEGADETGARLRIEAEPQFVFSTTLAPPMDLFVGQSNDFDGWRVFQAPTRLTWDGEVGWGHTEFSLTKAQSRAFAGPK